MFRKWRALIIGISVLSIAIILGLTLLRANQFMMRVIIFDGEKTFCYDIAKDGKLDAYYGMRKTEDVDSKIRWRSISERQNKKLSSQEVEKLVELAENIDSYKTNPLETFMLDAYQYALVYEGQTYYYYYKPEESNFSRLIDLVETLSPLGLTRK